MEVLNTYAVLMIVCGLQTFHTWNLALFFLNALPVIGD